MSLSVPSLESPDRSTDRPELSVLIVSYNTRDLTVACLESVYRETKDLRFEIVVVDNASSDGSADAIEAAFPSVHLVRSERNLGFAAGNNLAARLVRGSWLLLLNPDTLVLDGAIQKLLAFARTHPSHGIFGGRTRFQDGSLNPTSCWRHPSPWSLFCLGTGLVSIFRHTRWFDPESYGGWKRDSVREVDIVTGCFLLLARGTWERLGGFDEAFFMYGEEADLCLRARHQGIRALFCPDAEIVHYGGRSERARADKIVKLLAARRRVLERHWPRHWLPFGSWMQDLWVLRRKLFWSWIAPLLGEAARGRADCFREVWNRRVEWVG